MKIYILSIALITGIFSAGSSHAQTSVYCILNGVGTHCPGTIVPPTVDGVITEQTDLPPINAVPYDMQVMRSGYNKTAVAPPTTVNGATYGSNEKDMAVRRKAYSGTTAASTGSASSSVSWLYPNPVLASTRIVLNKITTSPVGVDVVDFNGVIRRSYDFAAGIYKLDIDMSGLAQGIYSVRVFGKDIPMENLKVVKQ